MIDYNESMGGVDESDTMMLYSYPDERRTLKKIVFNIFGKLVSNSDIIYKENAAGKNVAFAIHFFYYNFTRNGMDKRKEITSTTSR